MSLISDLIEDAITSGLGPSTSRGMMILGLLIGSALAIAMVWLLWTSPDPLNSPSWGLGAVVFSLAFGFVEVLLSSVVIAREPEERGLALSTLLTNSAAVVLAFVIIV
jgi:hypothetical protein